jgi:ribosomal protein S18 acetylase RimI-like enzyme
LITVTDITMEHAAGFREAVDAVASERRFLARTEAPPQEHMLAFVQTNIDASNPHVVALDDGHVVGWADIRPSNAPAMRHCGTLGMGVLAAYRGQGLGRRLLDAVVSRAWNAGLERVELEVRLDNEPAIALYERTGFLREGLKVRGMLIDGSYVDMVQMGLLKSPFATRPNISLQADRER